MYHFRGLATSQAMDQAQIGRAIASAQGWRTDFIRPRAIGQLQAHGKNVQLKIWHDTYNAPLPPLVDAIALFPLRGHLKMTPQSFVYAGDKAIAIMSLLLFFAAVGVLFFLARRLFDRQLAVMACGFVLVCDMMWQYSLSGLPQMLLLVLFNLTVYALVRAVEEKVNGGPVSIWLAAVGVGFGLLALSHALTLWMFAAAFLFALAFFRPRIRAAAVILVSFGIVYFPWLLRNYLVCGNPAGVAIYSVFDGLGLSEAGWMRRIAFNLQGVGPAAMREKVLTNLAMQSGHVFAYFGFSVVAIMFLPALLHRFKRSETETVRWMVFSMWIGASLGMAAYGIHEEQGVAANQFRLLFVPNYDLLRPGVFARAMATTRNRAPRRAGRIPGFALRDLRSTNGNRIFVFPSQGRPLPGRHTCHRTSRSCEDWMQPQGNCRVRYAVGGCMVC